MGCDRRSHGDRTVSRPLPPLRLGDLRDLTDAELRRHIFVSYMRPGTDTVRDECDACGGTGEQVGPDPFQSLCPACDGDGRVVRYATELEASSDAELAQRIGNVLVAYESVGMWGCDSAAYFLLEREGQLYEVHASHDSTCGFEGQWEPRSVTRDYLVSEHWGMSVGGYDEHRESGEECPECEGHGYAYAVTDGYIYDDEPSQCMKCDGSGRVPDPDPDPERSRDLSTRDLVKLWLHHRFAGDLAALPLVMPEWAIPKWALHVDKQGNAIDLRTVDDRYLLNIVRWACRKVRKHWHEEHREPTARGSFINAMREAEARGLVPTLEQLAVAWDLAGCRGHVDQRTGEPVQHIDEDGELIQVGPWDLVDLWVGYGVRGGEA